MINEIGVEGATKAMRNVLLPLSEKQVPKERQLYKLTGTDLCSVAWHLNISIEQVMEFSTVIVGESDKRQYIRLTQPR